VSDCKVIKGGAGAAFRGKQAVDYFAGVSAETTGSTGICMHLLEMPPGVSARPHYHEAHETAIFILEGVAQMRYGPNLEHEATTEAGDFVYIPPGMPHQPYNASDGVVRAVIARTDPNEQESVVLLDD
jgi:uncharacterized RmlC-like cupin family protein